MLDYPECRLWGGDCEKGPIPLIFLMALVRPRSDGLQTPKTAWANDWFAPLRSEPPATALSAETDTPQAPKG